MPARKTATTTKPAEQPSDGQSQALATRGADHAPMMPVPIRQLHQVVTGPPSPEEFDAMLKMAERIAITNFVPESYRGKPAEVLACIMKGREIGIAPMDSLSSIYMIKGRPSLAGELVLGLIRRAGHYVNGEASREKAKVTGKRLDTGEEHTVTWTIEDAKLAKITEYDNGQKVSRPLAEKDNWISFPRQMLWWRAVGELRGHLFSDVARGVWIREVAEDLPSVGPDTPPTSTGGTVPTLAAVNAAQGATAAAGGAPEVPAGQPQAALETLSAEQADGLRILNGSLPEDKQWKKAKVRERLANVGYMQTLGEMATDHFTVHGSTCPHFTYDMVNKTIVVHGQPGTAAKVPPGPSPATSSGPTPPAAAAGSPAVTEDPRDHSDGDQEKLL